MAVLAFATPDAEAGWPMCYLSDAVRDAGLAFAISDQGVVAPFTALRLLLGSPPADRARRVQMWTMDQTALMHDGPVPPRLRPLHDSAVALVLDEEGGMGPISVTQLADVAPADVREHLVGWSRNVCDGGPAAAVCGRALVPYWEEDWADEVVWAPPGLPADRS